MTRAGSPAGSDAAFDGKRALVTGGTGFIGAHLVRALAEGGAAVTAVARRPGHPDHDRVELVAADLARESLEDLLRARRFDLVFHLAGESSVAGSFERPEVDLAGNAGTTVGLLNAVRRSGTEPLVLLASSAAVYGDPERLPMREDDPLRPISPYGCSKLVAEAYLAAFSRLGVRGAVLRPFSVYGPGLARQVVFDVFRRLRREPERIELFGEPSDSRDFLFVSDAVDATLAVASATSGAAEAYNVGSGTQTTIATLVAAMAGVAGAEPAVRFTGEVGPGMPRRWQADVSRLRSLGWEPRVPLEEGLRRTERWIADHHPD